MSSPHTTRARAIYFNHMGEIAESLGRANDCHGPARSEHLSEAFNLLLECASATMDAITKEAGTPTGAAATVARLKVIAEGNR